MGRGQGAEPWNVTEQGPSLHQRKLKNGQHFSLRHWFGGCLQGTRFCGGLSWEPPGLDCPIGTHTRHAHGATSANAEMWDYVCKRHRLPQVAQLEGGWWEACQGSLLQGSKA